MIKLWWNADGTWTDGAGWSEHAPPMTGDLSIITSGEVAITNVDLSYQTVILNSLRSAIELTVTNSTLDTGSYLSLNGTNNLVFATLDNVAMRGTFFTQTGNSEITIKDSAVNYGFLASASGTATNTGSLFNAEQGTFANVGVIETGHGGMEILFGAETGNFGIVQADPGGGETYASNVGGTLDNHGQLVVNGGQITLNAAVAQDTGSALIKSGTLELDAAFKGGTITIQSGMLNIAGPVVNAVIPVQAALGFAPAEVRLTGASAVLSFGGTTGISEVFDASTDRLFVLHPYINQPHGTAGLTIQLDHNPAYTAADFRSDGINIIYTATPHI